MFAILGTDPRDKNELLIPALYATTDDAQFRIDKLNAVKEKFPAKDHYEYEIVEIKKLSA